MDEKKTKKIVRTTIIVPDEIREYAKKNRITISKLVILGYQYLREREDMLLAIKKDIEEIKGLLQDIHNKIAKT